MLVSPIRFQGGPRASCLIDCGGFGPLVLNDFYVFSVTGTLRFLRRLISIFNWIEVRLLWDCHGVAMVLLRH